LILRPYEPAHESTLTRAIPSIVLLGFAHFKGFPDPPNLDFALRPGNSSVQIRLALAREERPLTDDEKAEEYWQAWLQKVGLQSTNELEAEIVKFYRSGHPDVSSISALLDANEADHRRFSTQAKANAFLMNCLWYPNRTEESLLQDARELAGGAGYLDASMVTSLCKTAHELEGGGEVGESMVDAWLAEFAKRIADSDQELEWYGEYPARNPLHPRIAEAVSAANGVRIRRVGIAKACLRIHRDRAWGKSETICLSEAPVGTYLDALREAEGAEMIAIMTVMTDVARASLEDHPHFGSAGRAFVDACKQAIADAPDSRLTKLIVHLFKAEHIQHLL